MDPSFKRFPQPPICVMANINSCAVPWPHHVSVQLISVTQSCLTLCNPMDCSTASLSITNSRSSLKLMSIESVMPSNHLILCRPLLLPPSIFPSTGVFSNEPVLHIRWPEYQSFSFSISPSNEYSGLISFGWTGWISLQPKGLSRVISNTTIQKHRFFSAQLYGPTLTPIHDYWINHSFDCRDKVKSLQSNVSAF